MARITSKTNWVTGDIPAPSDLNRIENNNQQAFAELDAEVAARIADVNAEESARIADVNAEEAARIAADTFLDSEISFESSQRRSEDAVRLKRNSLGTRAITSYSLNPGQVAVVPDGIYYFAIMDGLVYEISTSSGWVSVATSGMIIGDGLNSRIRNTLGSGVRTTTIINIL